uniref:Uncharacterized protein n=1 Tax=Cucumis melo TaxID=3656 RepID=A0A9I9DWV9_CUCME
MTCHDPHVARQLSISSTFHYKNTEYSRRHKSSAKTVKRDNESTSNIDLSIDKNIGSSALGQLCPTHPMDDVGVDLSQTQTMSMRRQHRERAMSTLC